MEPLRGHRAPHDQGGAPGRGRCRQASARGSCRHPLPVLTVAHVLPRSSKGRCEQLPTVARDLHRAPGRVPADCKLRCRAAAEAAALASQRKLGRKAGLLSFDEPGSDAEEEGAAAGPPAKRGRMLSAHDAGSDARRARPPLTRLASRAAASLPASQDSLAATHHCSTACGEGCCVEAKVDWQLLAEWRHWCAAGLAGELPAAGCTGAPDQSTGRSACRLVKGNGADDTDALRAAIAAEAALRRQAEAVQVSTPACLPPAAGRWPHPTSCGVCTTAATHCAQISPGNAPPPTCSWPVCTLAQHTCESDGSSERQK